MRTTTAVRVANGWMSPVLWCGCVCRRWVAACGGSVHGDVKKKCALGLCFVSNERLPYSCAHHSPPCCFAHFATLLARTLLWPKHSNRSSHLPPPHHSSHNNRADPLDLPCCVVSWSSQGCACSSSTGDSQPPGAPRSARTLSRLRPILHTKGGSSQ